jgi:hypothetical protein
MSILHIPQYVSIDAENVLMRARKLLIGARKLLIGARKLLMGAWKIISQDIKAYWAILVCMINAIALKLDTPRLLGEDWVVCS